MALRNSWTNYILHLSAFISRKKNDLLVTHGMKGLIAVLLIVGAEMLLLIISIPSYLAVQKATDESEASKKYQLRRKLTLGTVATLLIIWVIKLMIIIFLAWHSNHYGAVSIEQTQNGASNLSTAAHDVLVAGTDTKLAPPTITKVANTHKSITIWGTAPDSSGIVFAFTQKVAEENKNGDMPPKLYTTWADTNGNFTLVEDKSVFHLSPGDYSVSAITYDAEHMTKSANSQTFDISISRSFTEWFVYGIDTLLNILALLAIIIGVLITILVS